MPRSKSPCFHETSHPRNKKSMHSQPNPNIPKKRTLGDLLRICLAQSLLNLASQIFSSLLPPSFSEDGLTRFEFASSTFRRSDSSKPEDGPVSITWSIETEKGFMGCGIPNHLWKYSEGKASTKVPQLSKRFGGESRKMHHPKDWCE